MAQGLFVQSYQRTFPGLAPAVARLNLAAATSMETRSKANFRSRRSSLNEKRPFTEALARPGNATRVSPEDGQGSTGLVRAADCLTRDFET